MRIGIASDHGGFALKAEIAAMMGAQGHEVFDFGAHALDPAACLWVVREFARALSPAGQRLRSPMLPPVG